MLKMMIAVDDSENSLDGVRHALALIHQGLRATVVLAHVQEPASLYELVTSRDPDLIAAASLQAGESALHRAQKMLEHAGVDCDIEVGIGDIAHTLIDMVEALGCDVLLIGSQGHGALGTALLGSVSAELVHSCPVPVTVVKPTQERELAEAYGDKEAD